MEYVTLNNGVKMPMVGFGVFEIPQEETARCVYDALDVGYRLIDTAQAYYNEEQVGDGIQMAIQKLGIRREDIFLTTKVWVTEFGYEKTKASVLESMKKLQVDYLDLVLIHQCLSDYYGAYHALEDLYDEEKIRAIGISNFSAERMADIATFNRVVPAVNQVETHLLWQQYDLHDWMEKYHIQHEAWGPLAQHRMKEILVNPIVKKIAENHGKTPAQIALRQQVQRGIVVIPKSTHKDRMRQNLDVFDFTLTEAEMKELKTLDEKKSMWAAYDDPMIVQYAMSEE
ncbi:aldo/keto reductase [uncultured Megasphaera sp.]|uniref:aldo/keto reductase n=1 Tax=uncultured Megasphaera sp. TaxID=165188 RepID=UPI0025F5603F|nr:aldo/keto reductase [uncultured Megasphaera sp.]